MIHCNLVYEYGKLTSIDITKSEINISKVTLKSLYNHCLHNNPCLKSCKKITLECIISVDYSIYNNDSFKTLENFLYGDKLFISNYIHIIPIKSNLDCDFFYLLDNVKNINSNGEIIALKNIYGKIVVIKKGDIFTKDKRVRIKKIKYCNKNYDYFYNPIVVTDCNKNIKVDLKTLMDMKLIESNLIWIDENNTIIKNDGDNHKFEIKGKCICGENLKIKYNRLICSDENNLCKLDYLRIINSYLKVSKDDELNKLYLNHYKDNIIDFIDYLSSLNDKIKFNNLARKDLLTIFFKDIKTFEEKLTIRSYINSLKYPVNNIILYKNGYLKILQELYDDK